VANKLRNVALKLVTTVKKERISSQLVRDTLFQTRRFWSLVKRTLLSVFREQLLFERLTSN